MSERHPDCNVREDLMLKIEKAWRGVFTEDNIREVPNVKAAISKAEPNEIT